MPRNDNICYQVSKVRFPFGQFGFDTAQVHLAHAQVRGDIMLGHPLDDVRALIDQVLVALFRGIPDKGNKLIDIMRLPLNGHLENHVHKTRLVTEIVQELVHMFFCQQVNDRRFDGFYGYRTGYIVDKAIEGGKSFVFEKELHGDIFPVFVEIGADKPLFDIDVVLRPFTFFEKDGFRRYFEALLEGKVLVPIGV